MHNLEQAAEGISLYVNANKTEYMCFTREGAISTLNGGLLKLEDKFTYLDGSFSSTKIDVNIRRVKAWISIDGLSIIWKSDLSDKIKRDFFQTTTVSILLYGCTTWTMTKLVEKKLDGNCTRMLRVILKKSLK